MKLLDFCKELENHIISAYEEGCTIEEAEKLASKFLHGQLQVSAALKESDLSARMRKSGLKAVRAAVYTDIKSKGEKLTVDAMEHSLNMNDLVCGEQDALDNAEVDRDDLKRYYDIFQNAHIFFRGIAKGNFGG